MPNYIIYLSAALLLLSGGCTVRESPAATVRTLPVAAETPAPVPESDGLAGSYRNSDCALTLTLDGCGGCTLTGVGTDAAGTYTAVPDGLSLDFGTRQETALRDAADGFAIAGRAGRFVRSDDATPVPGTERVPDGEGGFRYRDYDAHIACSCAAGTEILPHLLPGAVVAAVGDDSYVIGCNVTEALSAFPDSAPAFLEEYIRADVLAAFSVLYGDLCDCGELCAEAGTVDGRLAEASLTIRSADREIAVSVILYTSAYADGTQNYICKSCFAPADAAGVPDGSADAVTDMGAVRKAAQG